MARRGLRKLVDIAASSMRLHGALQAFLNEHSIYFQIEEHYGEGFERYLVQSSDLCCAQAILGALEAMAKGEM